MVRLVDSDRATPRSPPEPAGIDCGAALVARRVSSTTEKRGPCNGVGWAFKVRSSPGCAFCSGMRPSSAAGWKSPSRRAPAAGDSGLVVAGANSANKQLDDLQLQVGELRAENLNLQQRSSAAAREAQSVKMAAELDVQLLQGKASTALLEMRSAESRRVAAENSASAARNAAQEAEEEANKVRRLVSQKLLASEEALDGVHREVREARREAQSAQAKAELEAARAATAEAQLARLASTAKDANDRAERAAQRAASAEDQLASMAQVPTAREVIKEVIKEVPVDRVVVKEVPVDREVIKYVDRPVEREVIKEVITEVPVDREVIKYVDRPVECEGHSQVVTNDSSDEIINSLREQLKVAAEEKAQAQAQKEAVAQGLRQLQSKHKAGTHTHRSLSLLSLFLTSSCPTVGRHRGLAP